MLSLPAQLVSTRFSKIAPQSKMNTGNNSSIQGTSTQLRSYQDKRGFQKHNPFYSRSSIKYNQEDWDYLISLAIKLEIEEHTKHSTMQFVNTSPITSKTKTNHTTVNSRLDFGLPPKNYLTIPPNPNALPVPEPIDVDKDTQEILDLFNHASYHARPHKVMETIAYDGDNKIVSTTYQYFPMTLDDIKQDFIAKRTTNNNNLNNLADQLKKRNATQDTADVQSMDISINSTHAFTCNQPSPKKKKIRSPDKWKQTKISFPICNATSTSNATRKPTNTTDAAVSKNTAKHSYDTYIQNTTFESLEADLQLTQEQQYADEQDYLINLEQDDNLTQSFFDNDWNEDSKPAAI